MRALVSANGAIPASHTAAILVATGRFRECVQHEAKPRSLPELTFHIDSPAMALGDSLHEREAKAGALNVQVLTSPRALKAIE